MTQKQRDKRIADREARQDAGIAAAYGDYMTQKQHDKHIADNNAVATLVKGSSLAAAEPTPDGLGPWN